MHGEQIKLRGTAICYRAHMHGEQIKLKGDSAKPDLLQGPYAW